MPGGAGSGSPRPPARAWGIGERIAAVNLKNENFPPHSRRGRAPETAGKKEDAVQ